MRTTHLSLILLTIFALPSALRAQENGADEAAPEAAASDVTDAVSEQASKMEAELSKLRDTSPEAADLMLGLVDLYHEHGRVFGLIRIGGRFVARHGEHPQHKEIMLKLFEGLVATSRNKDAVVTARQFIARYGEDAEAERVARLLPRLLDQMGGAPEAAKAYEDYALRSPKSKEGIAAGIRASNMLGAINNNPSRTKSAEIREAIFDNLPKGSFATEVGWQAFFMYRTASQWAKSTVMGNKLIQKSPPPEPARLRSLHEHMAHSYTSSGQHANAAESWRKARAIEDNDTMHRSMIVSMYNGGGKAADLQTAINQYFQKYPQREDRFSMRSYLALAHLREDKKDLALGVMAAVLPHDAATNNLAATYVRTMGTEPAQLAAAEKTLLAAIGQNQRDGHRLRYALGLQVYRDGLKDVAKARAVIRDLITKSPSNDTYSRDAMKWLLYTAPSDAEFNADVQRVLKTRLERYEWTGFRNYLGEWIAEAKKNKDFAARAKAAQQQFKLQEQNAFAVAWRATEGNYTAKFQQAREKIVATTLSDNQASIQLYSLGYNYRYYGNNENRAKGASAFGRMAKRFPKRFDVAVWWLEVASDYAPAEVKKEAALHVLSFDPPRSSGDIARRLMIAATANKDVELSRKAYAWIETARQKFGMDVNYADSIGDALLAFEMEAEAVAYWQAAMKADMNSYYSRSCAARLVTRVEGDARRKFLDDARKIVADYHGYYAMVLADDYLKAGDLANFEKVLRESRAAQDPRPYRGWGVEDATVQAWVNASRTNQEASDDDKRRVFTVVRDLRMGRPSAAASLALMEIPVDQGPTPMQRLLAYQAITTDVGNEYTDWDLMFPYAQAAMSRKDYLAAATLGTGMLANVPSVDAGRKKAGRDLVGLAYSRLGSVGLAIDESSPIAPLLQAALYLRLGDERMAFEAYTANQQLFDQNRNDVPVDLLLFVCDHYIAAGGDENHDRVEDILRGWLVAKGETAGLEDRTKARVQLMLAKNYFKARRFDVARGEYTTVVNRFAETPEAIEAQFGIGETFMEQKVYDQAEAVFEKLAGSGDRDVMIRAEFLRGVLANRRGDRDEARDIFRGVLERVPSIELANRALFNLSEIYGVEQRFMDQLELLRTVGRLGRQSKRYHPPGIDLSIVVQDPDLAVSKGHSRIPVVVTTVPGGDRELTYLFSGGAGKGLFRTDLQTQLGSAAPDDNILQVTGRDVIKVDYPEEFKANFRSVVLTDTEMQIAANAVFDVSSSKIVDEEKESFSRQLERDLEEEEADERVSQGRPANQIKPGNVVHLRVKDADRDLTDQPDSIVIKLEATSGDQAQIKLEETGPHTGIFEGIADTGELPAGALASDTAIDHSPLMAIDNDSGTTWLSEPDGATPKWLSVDMKELRDVERVTVFTPDAAQNAPVRGELEGSHDGQFWFSLGTVPPEPPIQPVAGESGQMTQRVYVGNYTGYTNWNQIVDLSKNGKPVEEGTVDTLAWRRTEDDEDKAQPYAVLWHGKLVQHRTGAARLQVIGNATAMAVDGRLCIPVAQGTQTVDLWLDKGTHDVTIFSAFATALTGGSASIARADYNSSQITFLPFQGEDFDLEQPGVRPAMPREPTQVTVADGIWDFQFEALELRHTRLIVHEYLGESVAVNHIEIRGEEGTALHIPTQADVLALADNDILEIAAGDVVTATYTDEFTQSVTGRSRLLTGTLQATYFNALVGPITYDFRKLPNGGVVTDRKVLLRIDPGDRFIVEIADYDQDQSNKPDTITFQVAVNDGLPIEMTAQETEEFSGVFTKEVDTSAVEEEGKLAIKQGDRIYCTYIDPQNTFPGHAVPRESVVLVNEPSQGQVRIVETRLIEPPAESNARPQVRYLPPAEDPMEIGGVAYGVPLTVEVIDRDAAKDEGSTVTVKLNTSDGSEVEVECVLSRAMAGSGVNTQTAAFSPLYEGRFVGQIVLQLGTKNSPDLVPRSTDMPRNLIGGPVLSEEEGGGPAASLITRVLNVTGKDIVTAAYNDEWRPEEEAKELASRARLIANGTLACTDREYDDDIEQLHVGEKLYLRVVDPDRDSSDERDVAKVEIVSENGEKELLELAETLAHSGVFTGSVTLKSSETPTVDNIDLEDPRVETYFGDTIKLRYVDETASTEDGTLESTVEVPVVIGTDGLVAAFSKTFEDQTLAVETQFRIAESYFELFKSHKKLDRNDELKADLEAGRRILREVMEDYPEPKYAPRIAYLLGQFAQELEQWDEAVQSYQTIVRQFPDSTLAPDAQYKLAQCHEEAGNFNEALEAYVTLAATFPQSPLIANVMIRICDRFYKNENYEVAAQVGEKFAERFESHQYASRMAFRIGQCYYKAKEFGRSAGAFDDFAKIYPDDELSPQALFWSGESFRLANNNLQAFRRYNRCRWDFPRSDAAKYARGRLALPQMLQLFEQEANAVEQDE